MAKTLLEEDVKYHKYIIKEFDINIPEQEPVKVKPLQVSEMMIEKDFDHDHFAIFRVTLHLPPHVLKAITAKKEKVTFRIRLQKKVLSSDTSKNIPAKDVFNKNFAIYIDDSTPFFEEKEYKKAHGVTNKIENSSHNPKDFALPMDFYLFPEKEMNASKTVINQVFPSINITDAAVYTLGTSGISNLLMAPLDNNGSYSQLVLPALNCIDTIHFLEEVYGMYNDGALLFFDIDRNYLIPYNNKCVAWVPQEYKEVVMMYKLRSNTTVMNHGSLDYAKEKKFLVNILPDDLNIKTKSIDFDQTLGSNMKVIDSRNDNIAEVKSDATKRSQGSTKVVTNKYGNPFTANAYKRMINASNTMIQVTCQHIDIDIFKPNRVFKFLFEDTKIANKHSGAYQLGRAIFNFTKESGLDFIVTSTLSFRK